MGNEKSFAFQNAKDFVISHYRAAGALPQTAEDTIGRNPPVRGYILYMNPPTRLRTPHPESWRKKRHFLRWP